MWPNQQCQSTEGKEITRKTKLNSHASNKAVTQSHHAADNTVFLLQQPTIRRQHHSHHNLFNGTMTCSNMHFKLVCGTASPQHGKATVSNMRHWLRRRNSAAMEKSLVFLHAGTSIWMFYILCSSVAVTEALVLCLLLEDQGRITESIRILVPVERMKQKCFQITTKRVRRSQQFQLRR